MSKAIFALSPSSLVDVPTQMPLKFRSGSEAPCLRSGVRGGSEARVEHEPADSASKSTSVIAGSIWVANSCSPCGRAELKAITKHARSGPRFRKLRRIRYLGGASASRGGEHA